jgi:hypothetical protein
LDIEKIVDINDNKEDTIDRLLKLKDKVPIQKDVNSVTYPVLSQLNFKTWGK